MTKNNWNLREKEKRLKNNIGNGSSISNKSPESISDILEALYQSVDTLREREEKVLTDCDSVTVT